MERFFDFRDLEIENGRAHASVSPFHARDRPPRAIFWGGLLLGRWQLDDDCESDLCRRAYVLRWIFFNLSLLFHIGGYRAFLAIFSDTRWIVEIID